MSVFARKGWLGVGVLAAAISACGTPDQPADWYCGEEENGALFPESGSEQISSGAVGTSVEALTVESSLLWPPGMRTITVCWEDETWEGPDYDRHRDITREAVTAQWEETLSTDDFQVPIPDSERVRFVGWDRCGNTPTAQLADAIRIRVSDERPHAYIGMWIAGRLNGMVLNFRFDNWSETCRLNRGRCVRTIAVHEFGHALGFTHEQDRSDTPSDCTEEYSEDGDFHGGTWDLSSVMNYCTPDWNNGGELSPNDQRWSRIVYYPERHPAVSCVRLDPNRERIDSRGARLAE
ncbi:MAG: hypothetical protein IT285_15140 [Bdellovibrionales bacterium]|nr:hypothetical protein [Bdellovibrionales bacterium]